MYIGALPQNSPCTLFVQNSQGNSVRLDTTIIAIENQFSIRLQVCTYKEKPINMHGFKCTLEITHDGGFYAFELDNIKLIRESSVIYYVAQCSKESRRKNRRAAVRVPVGSNTVLHIGTKIISDCYVRDISGTGISFSVPKNEQINIGDRFYTAFKYKWDETLHQVKGFVVRVEELENGNYKHIGCEFSGIYPGIDKLVAEIQRDQASIHKRELLQKKL